MADERRRGPRLPGRPGRGQLGVAAVLATAGLMFTISAQAARGTQLRSERSEVNALIQVERERLAVAERRMTELEAAHVARLDAAAATNATVRELRSRTTPLLDAVGQRPVRGPALAVTLDDAPRDQPVPAEAQPDDLVVHQQDVQAVVNALWAGGAEAMMLQDQRVISTSAVRCVGNTLILQGRVYSPPYTVTAIGDVDGMRAALDASPEVSYYLQYVSALNLGWEVRQRREVTLPAYGGSLSMAHARVPGSPAGPPAPTPGATVTGSQPQDTATPRETP